jgi:predicted acetyltransferase
MLFHDFTMNFHGARVLAGGVGIVAVEFLRKKEHVAKEMIAYFLRHYRERGASIAMLYPFRPDFYERMGFGWGTKMNQYRVLPAALPKGPSKAHVRYLGEDDVLALLACYNRFVDQTHGMIERYESDVVRQLKNAQLRIAGYVKDDQIQGYLAFTFEKGESFIVNDLVVREFVYESRGALWELLTFLHTQADQIRRIVFNTQDEFFHHLFLDPRNGTPELIPSVYHESNVQGVGLMYRILDAREIMSALQERDFGGQTCRLKLTVEDSFLPENAGSTLLRFEDGRLHLLDDGSRDVEVRLDIARFSSLLVGAVNFESLYRYGLADISDPAYVDTVNRIFAVEEKPICMTAF